ncbi:MAG TPA: two-component sensor histidine kinase, partial [Agrobacterium sp.]|nr:two-component sensor histidine kinase [Agrobacterium sp.]
MNGPRLLAGWWPRSLRSRLFIILFAGLAIAYGLSFSILFAERYMSAKAVMLGTLEQDLAVSIAIIDRLPAEERAQWVHRLSRSNYQLVLGPGVPGVSDMSGRGAEIAQRI